MDTLSRRQRKLLRGGTAQEGSIVCLFEGASDRQQLQNHFRVNGYPLVLRASSGPV